MTVLGFAITNHPQQVGKRGAADKVDDRQTPDDIFLPLDAEFHFTVDAAASLANTRCPRFYSIHDDGLEQDWTGETVWCNPPYSNIRPWVEKALSSTATTVLLLPANRTEQAWWQDLVEPHRDASDGRLETRFLRGRRNFATPDNPSGKYLSSPPFGLVVVVVRP